MIVAMVGLLWLDHHLQAAGWRPVGLPVTILLLPLVIVGFLEYARLAGAAGVPVMPLAGVLAAVGVATMPTWSQWMLLADAPGVRVLAGAGPLGLATLAAAFVGVVFAQMARHRTERAIVRLAGTMLGILYLGALAAFVLLLRRDHGVLVLTLFLAVVKATDIGAYFTGTTLGRHKLIPWLSPGKSWEGLAGGILAAIFIAILLNWIFAWSARTIYAVHMSLWQAAAFGLLMAVFGQFGDLCESLLKRDAGRKDSGGLVPSFGGVLDIVDSPLVAAPAAYVYLLLLTGV